MPLFQEGEPLPGPKTGLLSNTRKWIAWGDTCWQSKRFYWERAPGWRAGGKGTQENCSAAWLTVSGFMVMGLVSGWSLANHFNSVFPGGAHISQPRWMLARGILGSGQTCSVSFWPFPNSSRWRWLISSLFLIRISCHKTTHANGYYGAWPGWAVSVSVLSLTTPPWETLYSRCFLGIGAEVSFFCNFFLLCLGLGLPSRAEVSLYLI